MFSILNLIQGPYSYTMEEMIRALEEKRPDVAEAMLASIEEEGREAMAEDFDWDDDEDFDEELDDFDWEELEMENSFERFGKFDWDD